MDIELALQLPAGWEPCAAGSAPGADLYWLPDYNSALRGYVLEDGSGYVGFVCEQGRNPFSEGGVVERVSIAAGDAGEAIHAFESFCDERSYEVRR